MEKNIDPLEIPIIDKIKEKGLECEKLETIHSNQGKTIKGEYTIHDLNHLTKKLIYTAVSRCTDYRDIKLFVEEADKKRYE